MYVSFWPHRLCTSIHKYYDADFLNENNYFLIKYYTFCVSEQNDKNKFIILLQNSKKYMITWGFSFLVKGICVILFKALCAFRRAGLQTFIMISCFSHSRCCFLCFGADFRNLLVTFFLLFGALVAKWVRVWKSLKKRPPKPKESSRFPNKINVFPSAFFIDSRGCSEEAFFGFRWPRCSKQGFVGNTFPDILQQRWKGETFGFVYTKQ